MLSSESFYILESSYIGINADRIRQKYLKAQKEGRGQ